MDGVVFTDGLLQRAPTRRRPVGPRHGPTRRAATSVLAVAAVVAAAGGFGMLAGPARAATANRAAVVVEVNGVIHTAKITFTTDSISGLDALRSAGFAPLVRVFGGNGGAVCALNVGGTTIGCPADNTCLTCSPESDYWAYWRALAGATQYTYSVAGAGNTQVHDGDVEAWAWSTGAAPSPFVSFQDVWGPDPPPTTTRPTSPQTTARRPPGSTTPTTFGVSESATTSPPTLVPSSSAPAPTGATTKPVTTRAPAAARSGSSTTGPATTNELPGETAGATRKVAAAPVVARGGGGSRDGLIGFATVLAVLIAAIVIARRRRSALPHVTT
jgi:hypothetical protein